jgi:hypothetical protein
MPNRQKPYTGEPINNALHYGVDDSGLPFWY